MIGWLGTVALGRPQGIALPAGAIDPLMVTSGHQQLWQTIRAELRPYGRRDPDVPFWRVEWRSWADQVMSALVWRCSRSFVSLIWPEPLIKPVHAERDETAQRTRSLRSAWHCWRMASLFLLCRLAPAVALAFLRAGCRIPRCPMIFAALLAIGLVGMLSVVSAGLWLRPSKGVGGLARADLCLGVAAILLNRTLLGQPC